MQLLGFFDFCVAGMFALLGDPARQTQVYLHARLVQGALREERIEICVRHSAIESGVDTEQVGWDV